MRPLVELVSTGSELLSGRTVNQHAQVLGEGLRPLGLKLVRDTTVPDDQDAIEDAVRSALRRVDLVVVSGGLGPTSDDLTRDVLARLFGRSLVMNQPALEAIRQRCSRLGRALNAAMESHALVLEGAEALPNSAGLAPGERLAVEGKVLFVLPGPPREFRAVLTEHVLPWLRAQVKSARPVALRVFGVCGVGESELISRLEPRGFPPAGVQVAYCAKPGRVEITLFADTDHDGLTRAAELVRDALGENIFAEDRSGMEEVVGRLLLAGRATLATAESCTGGLVGHRLTSVSGSSAYYLGGCIAYANAAKVRDLDVSEDLLRQQGAVSEAAARQMAEGVRRRFDSDWGLSVTGIAGPAGGTAEKPVGLIHVAVAGRTGCAAREFRLTGSRPAIQEWAAQLALDFLRRRLQKGGI